MEDRPGHAVDKHLVSDSQDPGLKAYVYHVPLSAYSQLRLFQNIAQTHIDAYELR